MCNITNLKHKTHYFILRSLGHNYCIVKNLIRNNKFNVPDYIICKFTPFSHSGFHDPVILTYKKN